MGRQKRPSEKKTVCTGSVAEFVALRGSLAKIGVELTTSTAYGLQPNGLTERKNRSLKDRTRAMLKGAAAEQRLRAEAILNAAYIRSRTATAILNMESPHDLLLGKVGNTFHFRTFGCKAFIHEDECGRTNKLDDYTEEGIYVGSSGEVRRVLIPEPNMVRTSNKATLDEFEYHYNNVKYKAIRFDEVCCHDTIENSDNITEQFENQLVSPNKQDNDHQKNTDTPSRPQSSTEAEQQTLEKDVSGDPQAAEDTEKKSVWRYPQRESVMRGDGSL